MIYFSDEINFKRDNFPELYSVLDGLNVKLKYDSHRSDFKKSWGNYEGGDIVIKENFKEFSLKAYKGFLLFDIAKYEILSGIVMTDTWKKIENCNDEDFWNKIIDLFPEYCSSCYKVAAYWVDYWLSLDFREVKLGINFGGSLIYARSFAEVLKKKNIPVYTTEHFFTGNDFYFERKYSSLPNNSIIKNKKYISNLTKKDSSIKYKSYFDKIKESKNKNVKQPAYYRNNKIFDCLLLCQVFSDFSILSDDNKYKNSIAFYKEFIEKYLNEKDGIIAIKTHPYEKHKIPEKITCTYNELNVFVDSLPQEKRQRVCIFRDESLWGLIDSCSYAVVLNSQSGLEVMMRGKPLICFGSPFYGEKGFTYDYDTLDGFFEDDIDLKMDHNKLILFNDYLKGVFQHLIGQGEVSKIMEELSFLKLEKKVVFDKIKNNENSFLSKKEFGLKDEKKQDPLLIIKNESNFDSKDTKGKFKEKRAYRLLRKFIKNPRQYFFDSKIPFFKMIALRK